MFEDLILNSQERPVQRFVNRMWYCIFIFKGNQIKTYSMAIRVVDEFDSY